MHLHDICALLLTLSLFCLPSHEKAQAQVLRDNEQHNGSATAPLQVGQGVTAPRAIYTPEPEFSETARKAGYQGTCVLSLVVGSDGKVRDVRVVRKLGMHLDEKAVEAVQNWTFEPGRKDGKAVPVQISVEVSFHLYRNGARQVMSAEQSEQIREARSRAHSQIYRVSESPEPRTCHESLSDPQGRSGSIVTIAELRLDGDLRVPIADREQIVASLKQRTYTGEADAVAAEISERVKAAWQNAGYFRVQTHTDTQVLTAAPDSERIAVAVQIVEGPQYRLEAIRFKNNAAITNVQALRSLFKLKDGDVFDRTAVAEGLENLRRAYGEFGYVNLTSAPDAHFNEENQTISLDITLHEGRQFCIRRIDIIGLDESVFQSVVKELPIKPGDIYNQRLIELFLQRVTSLVPPDVSTQPRFSLQLDEKAGTVDLSYDFRRCSG